MFLFVFFFFQQFQFNTDLATFAIEWPRHTLFFLPFFLLLSSLLSPLLFSESGLHVSLSDLLEPLLRHEDHVSPWG